MHHSFTNEWKSLGIYERNRLGGRIRATESVPGHWHHTLSDAMDYVMGRKGNKIIIERVSECRDRNTYSPSHMLTLPSHGSGVIWSYYTVTRSHKARA